MDRAPLSRLLLWPPLAALLLLLAAPATAQPAPAPEAPVPMPPALRARLRAARTDSARYALHWEAANSYTSTLDSAGLVGNLRACRRLGRRLGDSVRVGFALSNEGMYHIQVDKLGAALRLLHQAETVLSTSPDSSRAAAAYYLSCLSDDLNRPDLALRYARLALWRNRESPSNTDFQQTIYSLFGSVHLKQERLD